MVFRVAVIISAVLAVACGAPEGDQWVVRSEADTVTAREAGVFWRNMTPEARSVFFQAELPVQSFLQALGRRGILDAEIRRSGLIDAPRTRVLENAFIRNSMFRVLNDSLPSRFRASYTDEDLLFYTGGMGRTVWFSNVRSGENHGPHHLPELPRNMAAAFYRASQGELVTLDNEVFLIDSVYSTDSLLVAETLRDTTAVRNLAFSRLSRAETSRLLTDRASRDMAETVIDSSLVRRFAAVSGDMESPDFPADGYILRGPHLTLTPEDLHWEIEFSSRSLPVVPENERWLFHYIANLSRLRSAAMLFEEEWPGRADEIRREGADFARQTALDQLYRRVITPRVQITEEMLLSRFESLPRPPMTLEKRSIEMGRVPEGSIDLVRDAFAREDWVSLRNLLEPYAEHRDFNTGSLVSLPVTRSRVPDAMGSVVFFCDPLDTTTWHGPMETDFGTIAVWRTVDVIPSRPMTFDEAIPLLENLVREEVEEALTLEWITGLEGEWGLEINHGLLSRLPADPSAWAEL